MGNGPSSGGGSFGGGGRGGLSSGRGGRDSLSFGEAFSDAHRQMGAGKTFTWRGNSYTTNRAHDNPTLGTHHGGRDTASIVRALDDILPNVKPGGSFDQRRTTYTTNRAHGRSTWGAKYKVEGGRDSLSFGEAFSDAHRQMGAGKTFTWRGNSYTTNRAQNRPSPGASHREVGQGVRQVKVATPAPNWFELTYSGAKKETAASDKLQYEGVRASRKMAETDFSRAMKFKSSFEKAAAETKVPTAVLMGVGSRESRIGNALDKNGWSKDGNAFAIMQIDKNHHKIKDKDTSGIDNIMEGAKILKKMYATVSKTHPAWTEAQKLKGAVAAYNIGPDDVRTIEGMDRGTTHNDYSDDVMARAKYFKEKLENN